METKLIVQIFLAALFLLAGISHFRNPKFFLKITPPWVPAPEKVNVIVGAIEIALALALFIPSFTKYAAWGIIALLVAVFPANVYHFQKSLKKGKHVVPTLIRLPFQALFIYLAYLLTS
ncbi:MAG TPA: DoxX family membrane protein [Bacteroidetes bacterium]|nr:DoxX family membrane protein [Bacteroidota bacterium]